MADGNEKGGGVGGVWGGGRDDDDGDVDRHARVVELGGRLHILHPLLRHTLTRNTCKNFFTVQYKDNYKCEIQIQILWNTLTHNAWINFTMHCSKFHWNSGQAHSLQMF